MFILTKVHHMNGHCNYWLINLTSGDPFAYLQRGDLVMSNKKMIFFVKMANRFLSNGRFGRIGQTKKTSLIKMANGFLIK